MSRFDKILDAVLRGSSDANIRFEDLCYLLAQLGFTLRIRGSHHIFTRDDVAEFSTSSPKAPMQSLTRSGRCAT